MFKTLLFDDVKRRTLKNDGDKPAHSTVGWIPAVTKGDGSLWSKSRDQTG